MAYDEALAERVRRLLPRATREKKMMGGLTFMVKGKMCIGILGEDIMCRIDPEVYDDALSRRGCRPMDFTGRPMKGFVFVDAGGTATDPDLKSWVDLALAYNAKAKSSRKKRTKSVRKKPAGRRRE